MSEHAPSRPDWDRLYGVAAAQEGLFTTQDAADCGYSPQLLVHHVHGGRFARLRRGLYRLVHFPPSESEQLAEAWLWSEREGVISHQTALSRCELSDVLPAHIHLTLPSAWRRRRLRAPPLVRLHFGDLPPEDRAFFGAVPMTTTRRTLVDCAREHLEPDLLRQAATQALRRGLVTRAGISEVDEALRPYGGLAA